MTFLDQPVSVHWSIGAQIIQRVDLYIILIFGLAILLALILVKEDWPMSKRQDRKVHVSFVGGPIFTRGEYSLLVRAL